MAGAKAAAEAMRAVAMASFMLNNLCLFRYGSRNKQAGDRSLSRARFKVSRFRLRP